MIDETLETPTGKIHLQRDGAGPSLVILHHDIGSPGWLPLYERLAERYTVYVPDMPGFGESGRPDWARHPRDLAAMMHQLLDQLSLDPVVLVGLGFGGWVAAEMAVTGQSRLSSLVLVGAAGVQPQNGQILDQILISTLAYVRAGFRDAEVFEAQFGAEPSNDTVYMWELNREMTARISWKPYMFSHHLPYLLSGVRTPSLVVWGQDDAVIPGECGERFAEVLPDSRLVVLPETGHFVDMERPERLAELVFEHVSGP